MLIIKDPVSLEELDLCNLKKEKNNWFLYATLSNENYYIRILQIDSLFNILKSTKKCPVTKLEQIKPIPVDIFIQFYPLDETNTKTIDMICIKKKEKNYKDFYSTISQIKTVTFEDLQKYPNVNLIEKRLNYLINKINDANQVSKPPLINAFLSILKEYTKHYSINQTTIDQIIDFLSNQITEDNININKDILHSFYELAKISLNKVLNCLINIINDPDQVPKPPFINAFLSILIEYPEHPAVNLININQIINILNSQITENRPRGQKFI